MRFFKQNTLVNFVLACATLVVLAGCGGSPTGNLGVNAASGVNGAGSITAAAATLAISLQNAAGATVNSISNSAPATAKATLIDANGAPVAGKVVTFTTDAALATMTPANGTALTDAYGVATIQLSPANLTASGAATLSASAQLLATAVTGSTGFSIGAATVSMTAPAFGLTNLSAFGTTSVSVTVSSGGTPVTTPQTVNFTSPCASSGKASLSTGIATVNGVATASYRDIGCAGTDTITATVNGGLATSSATLSVTAPLAISLQNAAGATVNSISNSAPATARATLIDANGAPVAGKVVTFTTDAALATMTPANGTALTDAYGVATIQLSPANLTASGAATLSASAQLLATAVTGSTGFSIGAATVSMTAPAFGLANLSAFGTTSVSVTVSSGGTPVTTPQTVNFTSPCASSGKASLSTGIATVNGVATASYRDIGCAGTDTITATVNGGLKTSSATLTVTPPTVGSIQFVSAAPSNISLKGSGGAPTSQVTFKVVDAGGNPLSGKAVTFGLSTTVGGLSLASNSDISSVAGLVVAMVNSGTVSTPVRVTASTPGALAGSTLTTQSSQLSITTGIPDQAGFSLSASQHNIEGWSFDGMTTVLTARLADHFKNPVPDGTTVNFTAEAGSIVGTCNTAGGACSATFTSQGTRPDNGRVSVLAYAVGEETFTDLNGNGVADLTPNEMFDVNGVSTDLPEAWVDYNENGLRDANEPFFDFNRDGFYTTADGKYSGVLCDNITPPSVGSSPGACAASKTLHVRSAQVIVLSTSTANITINGGVGIALQPCSAGVLGNPSTFTVSVVDLNGNAMPAGTTIAFSSSNGAITSASSYIVPDTTGCRTAYAGCPAFAASPNFGDITVTMKSDAVLDATTKACNNANGASGTLTVTVTTPKGFITTQSQGVTD